MDPGRPAGEMMPLINKLQEALTLEPKFQPHLELPQCSENPEEITTGIRDGSAQVLRSLKVWYDLPPDVLFVAINLMDRFLTKMMVSIKIKYLKLVIYIIINAIRIPCSNSCQINFLLHLCISFLVWYIKYQSGRMTNMAFELLKINVL